MEIISTFRPSSRANNVGSGKAVDVTSYGSPHVSPSDAGDVHDYKDLVKGGAKVDTIQGEAEGSSGDAIAKRMSRRTIRPHVRYNGWNYISFDDHLDYSLHVIQDGLMDLKTS
jgi:hypothetical protein